MLHLTVFTEGGAQDTHRVFARGLDFEMEVVMSGLHGFILPKKSS
jgi:hypothetical protein